MADSSLPPAQSQDPSGPAHQMIGSVFDEPGQTLLPNALEGFPREAPEPVASKPANPVAAARVRNSGVLVVQPTPLPDAAFDSETRPDVRVKPPNPSSSVPNTVATTSASPNTVAAKPAATKPVGKKRSVHAPVGMKPIATKLRSVRDHLASLALREAQRVTILTLHFSRRAISFIQASAVTTARRVRTEAVPRVNHAARWLIVLLQRTARDPALLDHSARALTPSRLAVLSSATLTAAVAAAVSVDLISARQNSVAPQATLAYAAPLVALAATVAPEGPSLPESSQEAGRAGATPARTRPPAPPPTPVPQRRAATGRAATRAIQGVLNQYRDGFSVLEVDRVKEVWPTVDELALAKYFDGLYDQNFEFDGCRISVLGARATALCRGNVRYVLDDRTRQPRTEDRQWQFMLRHSRGRWVITSVAAREPGRISTATY